MPLPDFPQVTAEALSVITGRHGLEANDFSRLRNAGIFNAIYLLGSEHVLRVPREGPPFVAAIRKEHVAVPAARVAGVRTPALVAFDDSLALLPVPYASSRGSTARRSACWTWSPRIRPTFGTR